MLRKSDETKSKTNVNHKQNHVSSKVFPDLFNFSILLTIKILI